MTNSLDATGLTIDSLNEIVTNLEEGLKLIYGDDIIVDSNSPDGQLINLFSQSIRDILELIQSTYNSFDPDNAIGTLLDQRVTINNIERQGGTYTLQEIDISTDRSLTLAGLDGDATNPNGVGYTVVDDTGTEFILLDTANLLSGTTSLTFRAKDIGAIETIPNTITNPQTVVIGVTGINNPDAVLELGTDEETDASLRLRRKLSVANGSAGYLNGLLGIVLNINDVTDAALYENAKNITDANGIPAHGIWLIAEGGANTDISNAIYKRKSYGSNMKGNVAIDITTDSGQIFTAKFDRPNSDNLFIRFNIQATIVGQTFNEEAIKSYIVSNKTYTIAESANTSTLTTIAQQGIDNTGGGGVILNLEISDDGISYVDFLNTTTLQDKWVLDETNIDVTIL